MAHNARRADPGAPEAGRGRTQLGRKAKLARWLASLRRSYVARGDKELKRKERFLLDNPRTVGGICQEAEILLEKAKGAPVGSRARHKLLREAAALALGVAVPPGIGDLHRFLIGEHLIGSGYVRNNQAA